MNRPKYVYLFQLYSKVNTLKKTIEENNQRRSQILYYFFTACAN